MKRACFVFLFCFALSLCVSGDVISLPDWSLVNGIELPAATQGSALSSVSYNSNSWYNVTVPVTYMGALQENGVYPQPFYSLNLLDIPREQFSFSWWYRTVFSLPSSTGDFFVLRFEGINYRANIWVNGVLVADNTEIVGTFRYYDLPLNSTLVVPGQDNCIAVEIFRPYDSWTPPSNEQTDLAISWIDWAPFAPDGNAGLWRNVSLRVLGSTSVDVRYPSVTSHVASDQNSATLDFLIEMENCESSSISGTAQLVIDGLGTYKQAVTLTGTQQVIFKDISVSSSQLRLWWPWQMGAQEFYNFSVSFIASDGQSQSNMVSSRFGIRETDSHLTDLGDRVFTINGQNILIRGGGWSSDLLLRYSAEKQRIEMQYIRDMGLNAVRMEGKMENDQFYELADEFGILLLPGWACCDAWQHWSAWGPEEYMVAKESLRSEVKRTRIHPSLLVFLYSSDELPPADVEQAYLDVFEEEYWPNPTLNSAADTTSTITGPSGVKMSGPYVWEPPVYWLVADGDILGGARGFLTEGGPGASPMVLESLERTIPESELWPINFYWDYHCGNIQGLFGSLDFFTPPLDARYGPSQSAEEYLYKAQVGAYESHRAMFEAYSSNKYEATGVIHWMLNNPWPSNVWHMYDYYLNQGGSYFGIKNALQPLHAMYSPHTASIYLINSMYEPFQNVSVSYDLYSSSGDFVSHHVFDTLDVVDSDSSTFMGNVTSINSGFYFVNVKVTNVITSKVVDDSFYWYNVVPDVLDWDASNFYWTPCSSYADLTALSSLPPITQYEANCRSLSDSTRPGYTSRSCTISNDSDTLAFFIHLRMMDSEGDVIAPIFWEDNMFSLPAASSKTVTVSFPKSDKDDATINVQFYNNVVPSPQ